jgi:hypothetical protein
MSTSPSDALSIQISALLAIIKLARKHGFRISSHTFYSPRASAALAGVRKNFLLLKRDYPTDRFAGISYQLSSIEPLLTRLVESFPSDLDGMKKLLEKIEFKVKSDLAAEFDRPSSQPLSTPSPEFLPDDMIEDRYFVPKKLLWEVNRCHDAACYNACAALLRRLIENLIIGAYEKHGIADKIKKDGEYIEFGALIRKAAAEPVLKLGRETKKVMPALKFYGDLGAHGRMSIVRSGDLERLHNATRIAVDELARNL